MKGDRGKGKRLIFWNVAGFERQDKDFWYYIKGFDYIGLSETGWGKRDGIT